MSLNNYNFQKLTPIRIADLKVYGDALDFVFNEDDLKNIAITGSYSAGKSSVLETYKNQHPEKRFLHISLAHFDSTNNEKELQEEDVDVPRAQEYSEATLEGKILNQLIHQIDPSKIPQTHFKVKKKASNQKMWFMAALITLFITLIAYIFKFSYWFTYVQELSSPWLKDLLGFSTNNSLVFFSGTICIAILTYALYSLIKVQYNKNMFRKVSVQGNEIEIFASDDQSYFDKYLNEVLYLFENADVDVIVFEDMDRYNNNQIFEKLREINYLINKKSNKIIRFFYILRDDVFTSKDRTKFFDFIIPIVPVIDGSNSYDQFIDHFKQGGILDTFDLSFLQGLSLYIDDMRILKNIYNEYVIYYKRIQSTELNCNKLLAIIAYKNLFPRDFSDLQLGQGFVHCLFNNKPNFIHNEMKRLELSIIEKQGMIEATENELLNDIDELDAVYFTTDTNVVRNLNVRGKHEHQYCSRAAFINAMRNDPKNVRCIDYRGYNETFNFSEALNTLSQNPEYLNRKGYIEAKSTARRKKLNQELQELQKEKAALESKKMQGIISKGNIDEIFSIAYRNEIGEVSNFADVKTSSYFSLIKYLIRNGYIDETYPDYMTYFYEHSLSRADKIFLRSVTDEIAKEFNYELKNSAIVVSRLREIDFEHEEILNFDLLCYLLKSQDNNVNVFINQLKNKNRFDFISEFWSTGREKAAFIRSLNHIWPLAWKGILSSNYFIENHKQQYALDTIYYSPNEDIKLLNVNNSMTTYISLNRGFLNINEPNIQVIVSKLSFLEVKFEQIDYDRATLTLLSAVYEAELYQLNIFMISLILSKVYGLSENEEYKHKNYTLVISKPEECLVKYVKSNINQYIGLILDYCESMITDIEEAVLEILNNPEVSTDYKSIYITYLKTIIGKVESVVDKQLWTKLLQQRAVMYTENNVLQYYFNSNNKLDASLIKFINDDTVTTLNLDYEKIVADFGASETSALFRDVILCDVLSDEKYDMLLCNFNRCYKKFDFEKITDNKVMILITHDIIYMNAENLLFMRENYPDQVMFFICSNIEQYVNEAINEENFDLSELLILLEEDMTDTNKMKLLNHTSEAISVKQKRYSEVVKLHILEHNLDIGDLPYLIRIYNQEKADIKSIIKNISIRYIDQIISKEYSIPFDLLVELFSSEHVEDDNKISLLIKCLAELNENQVQICLQILKMPNYLSLFDGRRPKFEKNDENGTILAIFKKRRWISSYITDKDDPNYFRARGRNNKKTETEEIIKNNGEYT
ncbi:MULTISPECIES: hypothetical protein [Pelosinus]|uniref:YobI-like P-loop NTPase domain-containing protein n=1 Tax=Pelosinus fermentans B4 TaxID=1149862 RepID=I9L638_9FIRM|nr:MULTISPECIES: hypothetical protein [Pelosinus]EIW15711.1 hypothetical protein FB4_1400 [Pelosinus fermentans B4]EIW26599.1 hypothetical protein FA11_1603 [Pelosinus fermentans A11]